MSEDENLFNLLEELDDEEEVREGNILKAPFCYPGGKQKSADIINDLMPYRNSYIEPFGGAANVLLSRRPSAVEVYNDRFGGVVDFYRCMRNKELMTRLIDRLELTVHSREEFVWCKETWKNPDDIVERAARWYYITVYSFGAQGRNFGRAIKSGSLAGKIHNNIESFHFIHERLRNVQIENQDWEAILKDFDDGAAVFYCDPPYVDAFRGTYKCEMSVADHQRFLNRVFELKGFCAVSSYPNPIYEGFSWDDIRTWEQAETTTAMAFRETNNKSTCPNVRGRVTEALYIKEAQ